MNRELLQQALDMINAAIKSGDWKVDGACDPDSLIRRLEAELALDKKADNARELGLDYEPEQEPTIEDNSQDWAKLDGATAWHLIERHADNWSDVGKMMDEYVAAKLAESESYDETSWQMGYWAGKEAEVNKFIRDACDRLVTPERTPRKEWVGLTQDEIEEIYRGNTRDNGMCSGLSIALEVQLKLKEKNNAV